MKMKISPSSVGKKMLQRLRSLFIPSSLRYQLLSRSLYILAALLLLIGAFQYVLMKDFLYRNEAQTMISQMRGPLKDLFNRAGSGHGAGDAYDPFSGRDASKTKNGNGNGNGSDQRPPMLFLPDSSLAIVGADQSFLDITGESGVPAPQLSQGDYQALFKNDPGMLSPDDYRVVEDKDGNEQLVVFRAIGTPGELDKAAWVVQMGTYTNRLHDIVLRQLLTFVFLSLLALAGGLALYLPVLRRTLNPLNQMVTTAEGTNAGNLNNRFPAGSGQTEIDRLGVSFNGMMERLEDSFETEREAKEQMRRFVADASHELRTPLTSIHGFLEVLLRGAVNRPEQLHTALNSMLGESTRMKKLVEDLLTLAKLDRAPVVQRTETSLDVLIEDMEPHLRILAGEREVEFALSRNLRVMCDCDKIKQVILNLFHNAVQHTDPQQGKITITLSAEPGLALLQVQDNGQGIAEEHLPHVFERFYRSDASRTRKQGGAGLGLAISKSIVDAHGGQISVSSEPGKGALFTVILPAL